MSALKKIDVEAKLHVLGDGAIDLQDTKIGIGVVALKEFKKGDPITEYYGKFISHAEAIKLAKDGLDTHCRSHIRLKSAINGKFMRQTDTSQPETMEITDPKTQLIGYGIGAFCNDSANKDDINADFAYADSEYNEKEFNSFVNHGPYNPLNQERCTFIIATKDISPGTEICASYGDQYWQRCGIKKR